jgi:GNAT superfamily N-acetyltransferase
MSAGTATPPMPKRNGVSVRPARADERQALEEIQRRASLCNPGDRQALLANPDAIHLPPEQIRSGQVFVADQESGPLGFAVVLMRDDGDAELDGLFVEPDFWRCGIGRGLVDHAADHARSLGAEVLHVVGNPHAQGFYAKLGFVVSGEGETRFGPALLLRRQL